MNNEITDLGEAVKYLRATGGFENNYNAITAFEQLLTFTDVWNRQDDYIPDFTDRKQQKWTPTFFYNREKKKFELYGVENSETFYGFASKFTFKTKERAEAFGLKFEGLFNLMFNKTYRQR